MMKVEIMLCRRHLHSNQRRADYYYNVKSAKSSKTIIMKNYWSNSITCAMKQMRSALKGDSEGLTSGQIQDVENNLPENGMGITIMLNEFVEKIAVRERDRKGS